MDKFEERTIASETIFNGKVVKLQVDEVSLPDGNTSKREIIKHPGAVAIIPVTKDNKILFVEQYRKPLEKTLVEIPAGKLEPGEKPEITAKRELEEETGYTTNELTFLTSFYTSPGFADEIIHLYITKDLHLLEEEVAGDEDEFVDILELSLEEAEQLVKEQRIHDVKTAYAVLYLRLLESK
ncbi:NUDIX domain-containing protein [Sediminibacillus dalangtanensis]|uniref:NUDIX domain-containing protein n=1 Tax=Sediminibacillus dalangtanensis TaxID=2729421 RepID=A0ABX7VT70_9BACI|nr:NUDIX hydrolase [Sediminibacillus dalangtanensis]QTM99723.1 NUDIX domain-containing protein [Sediminibacillus dalangtanensis]